MRKYLLIFAMLALVLTACRIESNVNLDIEEDGSAVVLVEIGMDEEFRASHDGPDRLRPRRTSSTRSSPSETPHSFSGPRETCPISVLLKRSTISHKAFPVDAAQMRCSPRSITAFDEDGAKLHGQRAVSGVHGRLRRI